MVSRREPELDQEIAMPAPINEPILVARILAISCEVPLVPNVDGGNRCSVDLAREVVVAAAAGLSPADRASGAQVVDTLAHRERQQVAVPGGVRGQVMVDREETVSVGDIAVDVVEEAVSIG